MKTQAIMWGWCFNGKPSPAHLYKTFEEAMETWKSLPKGSSLEDLKDERNITLARVRVEVEATMEMRPVISGDRPKTKEAAALSEMGRYCGFHPI